MSQEVHPTKPSLEGSLTIFLVGERRAQGEACEGRHYLAGSNSQSPEAAPDTGALEIRLANCKNFERFVPVVLCKHQI